jgi:low affinity Fe/Cu permease
VGPAMGLGAGAVAPISALGASSEQPMHNAFNRAADRANAVLGSVWALILSVIVVVVWAATGPLFKFSDTWQLAINTGTTVVTFWMVFVIQNSQNRASKAVQLKLDEVIRALDGAENKFIRLEAATEGVMAEREAEMDVIAVDTAGSGNSVTATPSSLGPGRRQVE